jgi:hypothetical protein
MAECIDRETLEFLKTLLDMVSDAGPEGVQEICSRGNSECTIDQANFQSQVSKALAAIEGMACDG